MEISLETKEVTTPVPTMSNRTTWQTLQIAFNMINHILITIVSIYMTYVTYSNGNVAISWHVFLCTIGVSSLKILFILNCVI